jgi:hypothetical protein
MCALAAKALEPQRVGQNELDQIAWLLALVVAP